MGKAYRSSLLGSAFLIAILPPPLLAQQTAAPPQRCQLPPPMVCPPVPPDGPRLNAPNLDQYIGQLGNMIATNRQILDQSTAPGAAAPPDTNQAQIRRAAPALEDYLKKMEEHREAVSDYKEEHKADLPQ